MEVDVLRTNLELKLKEIYGVHYSSDVDEIDYFGIREYETIYVYLAEGIKFVILELTPEKRKICINLSPLGILNSFENFKLLSSGIHNKQEFLFEITLKEDYKFCTSITDLSVLMKKCNEITFGKYANLYFYKTLNIYITSENLVEIRFNKSTTTAEFVDLIHLFLENGIISKI